ncbi:hypothetical protein KKE19_02660 [Patescibacteria group bacterium]|nr:hypothetical protein [Patescibacteria group bacterium]MBU4367738.1 hypothetical protein [Patescibacteria group bacterium]MBU4461812.1 hypothetical protein [Patescibacteria group bacterium]MCG2700057.1 hypothetical protein [Candidatus Parcubacteria bacterium]
MPKRKFTSVLLSALVILLAILGIVMVVWSFMTAIGKNDSLAVIQLFGGFAMFGLALMVQIIRGKVVFYKSYKETRLKQRHYFKNEH